MNQTTLEPQPDTAKHPGRMYLILLIAYCILPVYGSIVSKNFQMIPFDVAIERFCNIPYQELFIHSRSDFIANILLFIPLTFLAMGAATRENLSRGKILIAIGILAGAFLISGIIEFAQLYLPSRTPSASDIFAQFIGGVLGIVIWFGLGRRITRWARSLMDEQASEKLAVKILLGYMVFLVLYQTFPFEVTLSPAGLWQSKLKHSDFTIIPFRDLLGKESYVYSVFSKIIITIPLGYLFMLRHKLRTWRVARTVAWAFVFSSLIEMAQMFIKNRFTSSTDIVLGSLGGLIGAMLAVRVGPVASNPLVESNFWKHCATPIKFLAMAAMLAGICWQKWIPFNFAIPDGGIAAGASEILAMPFRRQYGLSEFIAGVQVVRELTTFFFLGMCLRSVLKPKTISDVVVCCVVVVLLAAMFEFTQGFLPTRTADITATMFSAIGGIVGIRLMPGFVRVFVKTKNVIH